VAAELDKHFVVAPPAKLRTLSDGYGARLCTHGEQLALRR
jgi:hypothetical protein